MGNPSKSPYSMQTFHLRDIVIKFDLNEIFISCLEHPLVFLVERPVREI